MKNIEELICILTKNINKSERIFLVPHIFADVDTLASCFAIGSIAKSFNKNSYIIFDDELSTLDKSAIYLIDIIKKHIPFIKSNIYNRIKNSNDLIVICDVNKTDLIPLKDIKDSDNIIVIDHHKIDTNEINAKYKYIDTSSSSASEIVYNICKILNLKLTSDLINSLLAGIYLDTNKFSTIKNYKTLNIASELLENGADHNKVKKLFINDFLSDRKVQKLINETKIYNNIAICYMDDNIMYTRAELARAADYLIDFNFDAAFAVGKIDNDLIAISARSNSNIDVQKIMKHFNGGGTITSAAARIYNNDIENLVDELLNILNISKENMYEKKYLK